MFSLRRSAFSPSLLFRKGQLFVCLGVHKCKVIARGIEKLHLAFFEIRFFEPFPGSKGPVQDVAGEIALQFGPDERPAFARFHMLKVDDVKRFAVDHEPHAPTKIGR